MAMPETHVATCSSILDVEDNQHGPGNLYALNDATGAVVLYRVAPTEENGAAVTLPAASLKRATLAT